MLFLGIQGGRIFKSVDIETKGMFQWPTSALISVLHRAFDHLKLVLLQFQTTRIFAVFLKTQKNEFLFLHVFLDVCVARSD